MYVVTGGAGFIGSNIIAALEERGCKDIVVCDRLRDNDKWRNIAKRELADIVHPDDLFSFLEAHAGRIEAIFHMGAISATTETDADKIINNNFSLSLDLWHWCAHNDVRFIYASSAATYGDGTQGFDDNFDMKAQGKLRPLNAYGWSKLLFDRRIARLIDDHEPSPPQWAGLKFFNVYGPNEFHKGPQSSVVSQIYPRIKADEVCSLFRSHNPDYEDGGQLRDFVFVEDCVSVMMWLLDNPDVSGLFNLGTGEARSFKDLATAVHTALGKAPKIDYIDTPIAIRDKYQYFTKAPMDRLRAAGYDKPFTSLEDGVKKYVTGYLDAEDQYK